MVNDIVLVMNQRIASLIPKTKEGIEPFLEIKRNKNQQQKIETMMAFATTEVRNITWIQENGLCLDNIIPKRSTLKQAGNGAFAQRFIPKGSVVVPVPLLPIMDRNAMDMIEIGEDQSHGSRKEKKVCGRQLLLNYCFGHNQSSILLCPSSNAVLINHCSGKNLIEGDCTLDGPNAEIRWAKWDETNQSWLNFPLSSLQSKIENDQRGLSFDVVALRDIKDGEEVSTDNMKLLNKSRLAF